MATDSKTLSYSFSPDGTVSKLGTFTPSSGELWYVDEFRVIDGGGGGGGSDIGATVGVTPSNYSPSVQGYRFEDMSPRVSVNWSDTNSAAEGNKTAGVGAYVSDAETVHVGEYDGGGEGCTLYVTVHLRRIL